MFLTLYLLLLNLIKQNHVQSIASQPDDPIV